MNAHIPYHPAEDTDPVPDTPVGICVWAARELWRWACARLDEWRRPPARVLPFRMHHRRASRSRSSHPSR